MNFSMRAGPKGAAPPVTKVTEQKITSHEAWKEIFLYRSPFPMCLTSLPPLRVQGTMNAKQSK